MKQNNKWLQSGLTMALIAGLTACSNDSTKTDSEETETLTEKKIGYFQEVQSDDQLLAHVTQGLTTTEETDDVADATVELVTADSAAELSAEAPSDAAVPNVAGASESSTKFSGTYLQEDGVDESDIVKYDGDHLYVAEQPDYYYGWNIMIEAPESMALSEPFPTSIAAVDQYADIRVLQTQQAPASAQEIAKITLSEANLRVDGLFLLPADDENSKDLLAVVGAGQDYYGWDYWSRSSAWSGGRTALIIEDVADPTQSSEEWKIEIEGNLIASRRIGDVVYLVTRYYPNSTIIPMLKLAAESSTGEESSTSAAGAETSTADDSTSSEDTVAISDVMPGKSLNDGEITPLLNATDCLIPSSSTVEEDYYYQSFVTITAINLRAPGEYKSLCFDAPSDGFYASQEAIYFSHYNWTSEETIIHKFKFQDGNPAYAGSGEVKGTLGWSNPSFRFGERNGILHVVSSPANNFGVLEDVIEPAVESSDDAVSVSAEPDAETFAAESTTESDTLTGHRLTLLRESSTAYELEEVTHIPNENSPAAIGKPGEDVYAVRYTGNRAYVVTFERKDPLYILDISDSSAPAIVGELEVPGFSSLLHPIGDDLLLGFGYAADDEGFRTGYKVELFNVTDPTAPTSVDSVTIGETGSYSTVENSHHALSYLSGGDDENDRFALPIDRYGANYTWLDTGLYLYEIEGAAEPSTATISSKGALIIESASETQSYSNYYGEQRSIIHGDAVHYISNDDVWSSSWNDTSTLVGPQ